MPSVDSLLGDLDDEQREAVLAPRGPVCVLAGAGTGKTRTITRRIAHLVVGGHIAPGQVLAVTFTARAAGEMRSR
ncbi:MAG: UvrD-helicase domain-containing protein, partial [Mycobacterium sp.]